MTLKGQVAIVTGGAQGLGEHLCERLDSEGCNVIVADINLELAEKVANRLTNSIAVKVDVTNSDDVNIMVQETINNFKTIDILVSNAGILIAKPVKDFTGEEWKKVIEVNLFGYFLCTKAVSEIMIKNRKGNIIQINSKSGKKGSYKNSAYATAKFGGIGLTQSLALEFAEHNVRVNAICPGNLLDSPLWLDSLYEQYSKNHGITKEEVRQKYINQVPLKRGCSYDDVANVMVFLVSDKASYMTGQAINVTGGQIMY